MPRLSDAARHRSRTISFRTSEQTEYAIGLIARKLGLTKTAVLQFALRHLLRDPNEGLSLADGTRVSFEQVVKETWESDPAGRLARLAARYPELLGDEESPGARPAEPGERTARPGVNAAPPRTLEEVSHALPGDVTEARVPPTSHRANRGDER